MSAHTPGAPKCDACGHELVEGDCVMGLCSRYDDGTKRGGAAPPMACSDHYCCSDCMDAQRTYEAWERIQRDELLSLLGRLVNSPVAGSGDYILSARDIEAARAAIKKARGGSQ